MGTITLSPGDQTRLADATRTLVSPLEYPDVDAWRRAVNQALKPLLRADKATFQLPGQGGQTLFSDDLSGEDLGAYLPLVRRMQRRLWGTPRMIFKRVVALRVCDRRSLYAGDLGRYYQTEYYNEFIRPMRAYDALMTAVPLPDGGMPVQLYFHHDRPHGGAFEPRAHALLRLLHPALEAGIAAQITFGAQRARLGAALDAVTHGALLFDLRGMVLHRNPAASSLIEGDPEGHHIEGTARELARSFGSIELRRPATSLAPVGEEPTSRNVRTSLGHYRLRGSLLNGARGFMPPLIMIIVSRPSGMAAASEAALPEPTDLRRRFDLTARQAEVALLLARRLSNREIARALFISPHTAKNHTEMVLRKLGISSRREVRRRLIEKAPDGTGL